MKQFAILMFYLFQNPFAFGQTTNDQMTFFTYSYNKSIIKNNKVKTLTIQKSFSGENQLSKSVYHFDRNGLLTKMSIIDSKGKLLREYYFLTNSYNDLISRIQKDYENKKDDTLLYYKSYANDKLIKDSSSILPISYNYEYDVNGTIIKTVITSNFGQVNYSKREIIYKHDRLNRLTNSVETHYENIKDSTGKIFSDREFFYNKKGKIEREDEKIESNNSWIANSGSIIYKYDKKGNLTQILRKNAPSYSYKYNSKGLIIKKESDYKLDLGDYIKSENKINYYKFIYTYR
jgi:hypothetical protein